MSETQDCHLAIILCGGNNKSVLFLAADFTLILAVLSHIYHMTRVYEYRPGTSSSPSASPMFGIFTLVVNTNRISLIVYLFIYFSNQGLISLCMCLFQQIVQLFDFVLRTIQDPRIQFVKFWSSLHMIII